MYAELRPLDQEKAKTGRWIKNSPVRYKNPVRSAWRMEPPPTGEWSPSHWRL